MLYASPNFFLQCLSFPLLFAYIYHGYHGYLFLLGMEKGVILSDFKGIQSSWDMFLVLIRDKIANP